MNERTRESIADLRRTLLAAGAPAPEAMLRALERDPRRGARELSASIRKRQQAGLREQRRLDRLMLFESELWAAGIRLIAGVDEAGVAPLAGPVVAAAVILPRRYRLPGLDDSKKIVDERRRLMLAERIQKDAVAWSVGQAEVDEIDRLNIYHAGLLAMRRAVETLVVEPEFLLIDARTLPHCTIPQRGIVHGDALSASIAAASILAKTTRDARMIELDREYPGYGLASHKGYPTSQHLGALKSRGPLPIHRRSFGPVRAALSGEPLQGELFRR